MVFVGRSVFFLHLCFVFSFCSSVQDLVDFPGKVPLWIVRFVIQSFVYALVDSSGNGRCEGSAMLFSVLPRHMSIIPVFAVVEGPLCLFSVSGERTTRDVSIPESPI